MGNSQLLNQVIVLFVIMSVGFYAKKKKFLNNIAFTENMEKGMKFLHKSGAFLTVKFLCRWRLPYFILWRNSRILY